MNLDKAVKEICSASVTTAPKSAVRAILQELLKSERERTVELAVARTEEWIDKGFEITTLVDSLKIIKLEEEFEL